MPDTVPDVAELPAVIAAPKVLDVHTSLDFGDRLVAAVAEHDVLAVDLEAVEVIDTYGLLALVEAGKAAREHGRELIVVCTREHILRLFRVTTMDKLLDVRDSLEACCA